MLACACSVDTTGLLPVDDAAADIQVVDGGTDALVDGGEPVDAPAADVPTPDVVIVPTDAGGGCATFVSLAGNDDNTGTSESPLRTLTEALAGPGGVICVTTGTYSETLEITRPVVFRGGYTNFDEVPTGRSTVAGISSGHLVRGVRAEFERFSLTAQTASDRGTSSAALRAIEAVLVLRDVLLIPGNGARGDDGPPGENGGRGDDASDGLFADPPNSCSRGGGRGNGGTRTFQPGSGNPGAGPLGGTGGLAGRSQNSPTPGGNGGPGAANPGVGGVGAGGGELGALTSDALYRPAGGQDGEDGPPGGGGGGGGGGGADSGGSINFGGTGGHGGGGGCGGAGGGGGGGGGGSFGIVAVSSTIELVEVTVTRGGGGAGGNGRTGGSGGAGGSGAPGTSDFVTTAGGNGGNGGNGGRGGQGGGGGGGPSLGYLVDASTTLIGAPTAAAGFAGNGGGGGATGSRGLFDVGAVTSVE